MIRPTSHPRGAVASCIGWGELVSDVRLGDTQRLADGLRAIQHLATDYDLDQSHDATLHSDVRDERPAIADRTQTSEWQAQDAPVLLGHPLVGVGVICHHDERGTCSGREPLSDSVHELHALPPVSDWCRLLEVSYTGKA